MQKLRCIFIVLFTLMISDASAEGPVISGFSVDGQQATQKTADVYEHEGTEFRIVYVSTMQDNITFDVSYAYEGENYTERLTAQAIESDAGKLVLPGRPYSDAQHISDYRDELNDAKLRNTKNLSWNHDQAIAFEHGENWTPLLTLKTEYDLYFFDPVVTDQENNRVYVNLPYGEAEHEPYGNMCIKHFSHKPPTQEVPADFYFCDGQGHLKKACRTTYSAPEDEARWLAENGLDSPDYESNVTGERIGYVKNAQNLHNKYLTFERNTLRKSPYIYANGRGQYFIASVTECKFTEDEGGGSSYTEDLVEKTTARLKLHNDALLQGDFNEGFYSRASKAGTSEEWVELGGGESLVRHNCHTGAFVIIVTENMTKEQAVELKEAVHQFKKDGESVLFDQGDHAAGDADHILLFQVGFNADFLTNEFDLKGFILRNKAIIHLATQNLDKATARTVKLSPQNFTRAWAAFISLKKCTPTFLDLTGCDLSACLAELKNHVGKNKSLETLNMGKSYAPQQAYYDLIAKLAAHKKLKEFHVDEFIKNNNISKEDAERLYPKLRGLVVLIVPGVSLSRHSWPLKDSAKTLKKLDISNCSQIGSRFVGYLKECTELVDLNIVCDQINGGILSNNQIINILKDLSTNKNLKKLSLTMPYFAFVTLDAINDLNKSFWKSGMGWKAGILAFSPLILAYTSTISELKGSEHCIDVFAIDALAKIPALQKLNFKLWGLRKYPDAIIAKIQAERASKNLPPITKITYVQ